MSTTIDRAPAARKPRDAPAPNTREVLRKALIACGVLSSLLYIVATDVVAAAQWEGYSRTTQIVSDLFAVGAPSRPILLALFYAYDVLIIAFGIGVWVSARSNRALRVSGSLLVGYGAFSVLGGFFPLDLNNDAAVPMHIVATVGLIAFMLAAVVAGGWAFGKRFRLYSIATIATTIVGSILSFIDVARDPTTWLGITERLSIGAFLLWVAVLAAAVWRRHAARS